MLSKKKFIEPEKLPILKEDFQSVIDDCKPDPRWKMAYAKFALSWNQKFWKTLWHLPSHTYENSSWVFSIYRDSIQEDTREEIERIFGWIILKVWYKTTPKEELWDNISLLPERKIWKHTDKTVGTNISNQEKKIELPTEDAIYTQFMEGFLTCDDIINPEKLLPRKEEIIIDTEKWTVKCKRDYMSRISASQKDVVIDFTVWFQYKR